MKLSRLELKGFKSFADRTLVEFRPGVTAVVGPNGCGKSNVVDAIRWVLGERRPTRVRGGTMQQVIFQGAGTRRASSRATVSVVIDNEDGALPVASAEVEIGRSMDREGRTEYTINRTPCRLRDVTELCRDTGLGVGAYSVIEDRGLTAILSSQGSELRELLEEAAGIGRYKDRRAFALRRLEAATADLRRLDDLMEEVKRTVRKLAREKGRTQRYLERRARRKALDVTLARKRLSTLRDDLARVEAQVRKREKVGWSSVRALREAEAERARLDALRSDGLRARSEAAERMARIADELALREREMAVAEERSAQAKARMARSRAARATEIERRKELESELAAVEARATVARERSERADKRARPAAEGSRRLVRKLAAVRARIDDLEEEARKADLEMARLRLELRSGKRRINELGASIATLAGEREGLVASLNRGADANGPRRARDAAARAAEEAAAALAEAEAAVSRTALALHEVRERERSHTARVEPAELRHAALVRLERDRDGFEPVVRAVLDLADDAVRGPLADFIRGDRESLALAEAHLGELTRAIVVDDSAAALRLAGWFGSEWNGGGGLTLLPLDAVGDDVSAKMIEVRPDPDALVGRLMPEGEGAIWVRELLEGARTVRAGEIAATIQNGVCRVGSPAGFRGLLERRNHLVALGEELDELRAQGDALAADVAERTAALRTEEQVAERARKKRDSARTGLRRLEEKEARQVRARERNRSSERECANKMARAEEERARVSGRMAEVRSRLETLHEDALSRTELLEAKRERLAKAVADREHARAMETRLAVRRARAEAESDRREERVLVVKDELARLARRVTRLDSDSKKAAKQLADASGTVEKGGARLQRLFEERERAKAEVAERDRELGELSRRRARTDRAASRARSAEREWSDTRRELDHKRSELAASVRLIEERVQAEWGRSIETLAAATEFVEGEEEEIAEELRSLVRLLDLQGPVNVLAVEEHAEARERLEFLASQRDDLASARKDLTEAIRDINRTAAGRFGETFEAVQLHFRDVYGRLFDGGTAELRVGSAADQYEGASDPLEPPIEIRATPRGKRVRRMDLLSGGERALTALSLLFAFYLVKPSPFCVMDEVDATLDEHNIGRFARLLASFKARTQFIVITHNPRTVAAADWLYGVTMEEAGISTLVAMRADGEPLPRTG